MKSIQNIRNADKHLVGKYNPNTSSLIIALKGCITTIRFFPNGEISVNNTKTK